MDVIIIHGIDTKVIKEELDNLPTDKYEVTLLSTRHITDPEHKLNFKDTIGETDIEMLNEEHYDWLCRYGYILFDDPRINI